MALFGDAYRGKRVLVTGHTGFKGSWLTSWLIRLGANICGYSNQVPTTPSLFEAADLGGQIRHEIGDVRDSDRFAGVFRDVRPDFLFHLAAQAIVSSSYSDPIGTMSTNVMGTANVLDALRHATSPCAAVIITSDKCYENVEWPWGYRETDRLGGQDVYSGSKGAAELAFHCFYNSFFTVAKSPVRLCTARAGNVIGGGDWAVDRIVADCMRSWAAGTKVKLRSPSSTRPWQHVLEPLSGYLTLGSRLISEPTLDGESFNFGPRSEQNNTVMQLLTDLAKIWGHNAPGLSYDIVDNSPFHEATILKLNIDKAMSALKWLPTLSYEECVDMTGSWYRDVVKFGSSARTITTAHIRRYELLAEERQRVWVS